MRALNYCHISPNMAWFCKLLAQNWHKNSALVRACSGFTWRVSDCEELSLARGGIERASHGFILDSQTHY